MREVGASRILTPPQQRAEGPPEPGWLPVPAHPCSHQPHAVRELSGTRRRQGGCPGGLGVGGLIPEAGAPRLKEERGPCVARLRGPKRSVGGGHMQKSAVETQRLEDPWTRCLNKQRPGVPGTQPSESIPDCTGAEFSSGLSLGLLWGPLHHRALELVCTFRNFL